MAEPPILTIRRDFLRPSADHLGELAKAPTGWIADANGRRGALAHWIRPLTTNVRFSGVALTVRARARDNLAPYAALKFAKRGDVLVIQTDAYEEAAVLGDIMLGMAKNAGVVAAVTDGMVRDIEGLNSVGIPVFARGLTPNSPFKDGPGEIGTSVVLGGVEIASGDFIAGDENGVVVVPRGKIATVTAELSTIAAKEAKMDSQVRSGAIRPDWIEAILSSPRTRYLD